MVKVRKYGRKAKITTRQREIAKRLATVTRVEEETPFTPFTTPTPENMAMMPHYRTDTTMMGTNILVPPEKPGCSFTDYEKEDAEMLAEELRKLKGQPVILSGGGGGGAQIWFLQDVRVVPFSEPKLDAQGRAIPKEGDYTDEDVWYVEDLTKPIRKYSVKVYLDNPYPVKDSLWMHDRETFDPWIGSWRITALEGYGADKIRKDWPSGWD